MRFGRETAPTLVALIAGFAWGGGLGRRDRGAEMEDCLAAETGRFSFAIQVGWDPWKECTDGGGEKGFVCSTAAAAASPYL
jgi:hypothetical protein